MSMRNVSGVSITQTESGEAKNSTCAGAVHFHVANVNAIRHYTTPAGLGTDCNDSLTATYEAGAGQHAAASVGLVTITAVEDYDTVTLQADF